MTTSRSASIGSRASTYVLLAAGMALFGSATPVSKLVGEVFPSMVAPTRPHRRRGPRCRQPSV